MRPLCAVRPILSPGKGFTSDQDKLLVELQRTRLDSHTSVMPPGGPPTAEHQRPLPDGSPSVPESTRTIFAQPTKALDDAVFGAAQLLKSRPRNRRKIIFIVSDGINGGKKYNTNTYDNVIKELLGHSISVFGVGVGSAIYDRKFERLSGYAHNTGGDVYYAANRESLGDLYSRITEEARNEYTPRIYSAKDESGEGLPRGRGACEARRADHPHPQPVLHSRNRPIKRIFWIGSRIFLTAAGATRIRS